METPALKTRTFDDTGIPLLVARVILGTLFIYMGIKKVVDPVSFLKMINEYRMLPTSPGIYLNATAIILPWVEIVAGSFLLVGILIRGAATAIAIMLAVFTPAILLRALAVLNETGEPFSAISFDCGCGAGEVVIWKKLLENSGLFIVALVAIFSRSRRFCLSGMLAGNGKTEEAESGPSPVAVES